MSNGDQITYIGVPLTVAGVIPLLWNMGKALWIRRKLLKSISPELRDYYSLIADPAAGTVTVVARTPRLALPGLWTHVPDAAVPAKSSQQSSSSWKVLWELLRSLFSGLRGSAQHLALFRHRRSVGAYSGQGVGTCRMEISTDAGLGPLRLLTTSAAFRAPIDEGSQ